MTGHHEKINQIWQSVCRKTLTEKKRGKIIYPHDGNIWVQFEDADKTKRRELSKDELILIDVN